MTLIVNEEVTNSGATLPDTGALPENADTQPQTDFKSALKEFVGIYRDRKRLETEQKRLSAAERVLEDTLLEMFSDMDVSSIRVEMEDGTRHTVFLQATMRAKLLYPESPEGTTKDASDAMRADFRAEVARRLKRNPNYSHLVKQDFNLMSLTAYLKEMDAANKPLPRALKSVVGFNSTPELRIRKATN